MSVTSTNGVHLGTISPEEAQVILVMRELATAGFVGYLNLKYADGHLTNIKRDQVIRSGGRG